MTRVGRLLTAGHLAGGEGGGGPPRPSAMPSSSSLAEQQHHKDLLARIERTAPDDPAFDRLVQDLAEEVRTHVAEEERDLFPRLDRAVAGRDAWLLDVSLFAARLLAPTRVHPHANRPPWNVVAGLSVAPIDRARDLTELAVGLGTATLAEVARALRPGREREGVGA